MSFTVRSGSRSTDRCLCYGRTAACSLAAPARGRSSSASKLAEPAARPAGNSAAFSRKRRPILPGHLDGWLVAAATTPAPHRLRGGNRDPRLSSRRFAPGLDADQDQPIRIEEGDPNGLEDSEDCRTAGRSGNQHVRLRGAQVTGRLNVFGCGGIGLRGRSDDKWCPPDGTSWSSVRSGRLYFIVVILLSFGEGGPSLLKCCAERSGRIKHRCDGIRLDRFPAIRLAIHLSAM